MMALTWEGTYIPPHSQAVTGIDNANTARSAVKPISGIDYSSDSMNFYRTKQVYFPQKFLSHLLRYWRAPLWGRFVARYCRNVAVGWRAPPFCILLSAWLVPLACCQRWARGPQRTRQPCKITTTCIVGSIMPH